MCLVRGAFAFILNQVPDAESIFPEMEHVLKQNKLVNSGDTVIFTAGLPTLESASTNTLTVRIIA